MQEEINKNVIIKEYSSLGPEGMSKKYGKPKRYFVRRANILKVKWKKRKGKKLCIVCGREMKTTYSKSVHCRSCKAKERYKNRGAFSSGDIFSSEEIKYLKDNYETASQKELCSKLNRSWQSISHKGLRLGLKRDEKFLIEGNKKGREYFIKDNPMHNEHREKSLKAILVSIRERGMTDGEKTMDNILNELNIKHEWNREIKTEKTIRMVDFFVEPNIIIEIDGGIHNLKSKKDLDEVRDREFFALELKSFHFNDKQLENQEEVKQCLKNILQLQSIQ